MKMKKLFCIIHEVVSDVQGCYRKLVFIKDIPNSKLNAFHLNIVYFQWVGKGTMRIRSFVFSPLSFAFFSYYIEIAYFIYSSEACYLCKARMSLGKQNGKLECDE